MAEACLFTHGVAETLYSWLPDKKSFSATSRGARVWFKRIYFPRGLYPRRMTVRPQYTAGRTCASVACRKQLPKSGSGCVMGMVDTCTLGMLRFCSKPQCREAAIKKSYSRVMHALLLDAGREYYLAARDFSAYINKALEIAHDRLLQAGPDGIWSQTLARDGAKTSLYSRVRSLHDSIVSAMFERAMAADDSDKAEEKIAWQLDPREAMVLEEIAGGRDDQLVMPDKKTFESVDAIKNTVYVSF